MPEEAIKFKYSIDHKINLVIAVSTFILAFIAFVGLIFALAKFEITSASMILLAILVSMAIIIWMIVRWIKNE